MQNIVSELMNLHPVVGTAIIAGVLYYLMNGWINNKVKLAISIPLAALIGMLLNAYVENIGIELLSALIGVLAIPKIVTKYGEDDLTK